MHRSVLFSLGDDTRPVPDAVAAADAAFMDCIAFGASAQQVHTHAGA
jgi:hypothetical protein